MNASEQITSYIEELNDWRGSMIRRLRQVILEAEPDLVEEWKWNTPVWSKNGGVVAVSAFKKHVKINFFNGAALADRQELFNAGLDAKKMRSIDLFEGDGIETVALKELVRAAAALNKSKK